MNKNEGDTTIGWTTPPLSRFASASKSTATCRPNSDPRSIPLGLHRLLSNFLLLQLLLIDGWTKAALFESLNLEAGARRELAGLFPARSRSYLADQFRFALGETASPASQSRAASCPSRLLKNSAAFANEA